MHKHPPGTRLAFVIAIVASGLTAAMMIGCAGSEPPRYAIHHRPIVISDLEPQTADGLTYGGRWEGALPSPEDAPAAYINLHVHVEEDSPDGRFTWMRTVSVPLHPQSDWQLEYPTARDSQEHTARAAPVLERAAGRVSFHHVDDGARDAGTVTLTLRPTYQDALAGAFGEPVTPAQVFALFWLGVEPTHVTALLEAGYDVGVDGMLERGVGSSDVAYAVAVRDAGYELSLDETMRLRRSGVSTSFLRQARSAGYDLGADELIALRRSGMSTTYMRQVRSAGYELGAEDLITLRRSGMSTTYMRQVGEAGYELSIQDLIALRRSGMSTTFVRQVHEAGYELSVEDLITLRRSGMSTTFMRQVREAGYELSVQDLIALRRSGMSTTFMRQARDTGYELSVEDLIALRRAGVSPSYLASLAAAGVTDLTAEQIIHLRRRGIDARTIAIIRETP